MADTSKSKTLRFMLLHVSHVQSKPSHTQQFHAIPNVYLLDLGGSKLDQRNVGASPGPGLTWARYYTQFQNLGGICEVFVEGAARVFLAFCWAPKWTWGRYGAMVVRGGRYEHTIETYWDNIVHRVAPILSSWFHLAGPLVAFSLSWYPRMAIERDIYI
jgi:hypothetical protein